jgi:hypothetical protein
LILYVDLELRNYGFAAYDAETREMLGGFTTREEFRERYPNAEVVSADTFELVQI